MNKIYIFLLFFIICLGNSKAQHSYQGLKDVAIEVATIRKSLAQEAGFTSESETLGAEIAILETTTFEPPIIPTQAIGFNPVPNLTSNPHLDALYIWAEDYLAESDPNYGKASTTNELFNWNLLWTARGLVSTQEKLIWLILSPQSRYQYHPTLFKRLLLITYATSDDYLINGATNGHSGSALDDWFSSPGAIYSWKNVATSFNQYIPNFLKTRFEQAADKMLNHYYSLSISGMGSAPNYSPYCNRDISYAEVLIHGGQYRNNENWLNRGLEALNVVLGPDVLYPDGAYSYLYPQNEVPSYHGATTNSLIKLYSVTGLSNILTGVANAKNYELLTYEDGWVAEYYTAPVWKTQWYGEIGESDISLSYISNSPHLKSFFNRRVKENEVSSEINDLVFYNSNIMPAPLPNNYLVYDKNIKGLRRRYNDFSYGLTTRNVGNVGHLTLTGALVTEQHTGSKKRLNSALLSVQAKVHTNSGNVTEWDKWAYMMGNMNPKINMSKSIGTVSTPISLYRQTAGPTGHLSNWNSFQQWVTLPDRIIGIVEVYPKNNTAQNAYEIDGRIKLGINKNIEVITPGVEYDYENLKIIIHEHDFTTVDTAPAGVLRDSPLDATEIRLRYDLSNNGTTLTSYPGTTKKYFITEIRYKNATGNINVQRYNVGEVKGLIVTSGTNKYSVFRNLGTTNATVDVSSYLNSGNTNKVHYSRTDDAEIAPTAFSGTTLSIPANEQRLLISSNLPLDNEQSWENFDVLLDELPGINIESDDAKNATCIGEPFTFTAITDNLGANTNYQWRVDDEPVPGEINETFSTTTLTNGQKVNCVMTTSLPDNSEFNLKSNDIIVKVATKPTNLTVSTSSAFIFEGNVIRLSASATGATSYEWSGPNNFKSSQQNPVIPFAKATDSGVYTVVANNNGCYSDPETITIIVKDKHIWRGYVDSNYGNDANWDFGYPKFNIGDVEIEAAAFQPIINQSGAFTVPSLKLNQNSNLDVNGFLNIGNLTSYVKTANFSFSSSSSNMEGSVVSGIYQIVNEPTDAIVEFKWFRADDQFGNNAVTIGTSQNYTITNLDNNKFIAFSVTLTDVSGTVLSVKTSEFRKTKKVNITDNQPIAPTALYSFRKLKNDYTGAAFRVRRDKDDKELDISFDSAGYLDAEILLQFVSYGNGFVTKWYDQSGNNLDAVQSDPNKQPLLVKNGKIVTNNFLPALEFSDTDILEVPTSTLFDAPSGFALFVSAKQLEDNLAAEYRFSMAYRSRIGANGNGGSTIGTYGFRNIFNATYSRQVIGFMRNSSNGILSNGTVTPANYRNFANQSIQLTNYCNGSGTNNNIISVNNNQFSLSENLTLATSPINGNFTIGNRSFLVSSGVHYIIGEIILYNQPISATQRDEIEKNMLDLN